MSPPSGEGGRKEGSSDALPLASLIAASLLAVRRLTDLAQWHRVNPRSRDGGYVVPWTTECPRLTGCFV